MPQDKSVSVSLGVFVCAIVRACVLLCVCLCVLLRVCVIARVCVCVPAVLGGGAHYSIRRDT